MCLRVLLLISQAQCFHESVLCLVSAEGTHTHIRAASSKSSIKPDECTSQDNCWFCQGGSVVQVVFAIPHGFPMCADLYYNS